MIYHVSALIMTALGKPFYKMKWGRYFKLLVHLMPSLLYFMTQNLIKMTTKPFLIFMQT